MGRIIVDSFAEIARLGDLAAELGVRPRVMVRVTTGVEAHTHEYIATAHEDQKFGFSIAGGAAAEALQACHEQPALDLVGIHSHIGSQIFDAEGFEVAARRTLRLHAEFARAHRRRAARARPRRRLRHRLHQRRLPVDPDGAGRRPARDHRRTSARRSGIAVPAPVDRARPGDQRAEHLRPLPGRHGQAGRSSTAGASRLYVAVDGGMSDNIRTALYAAEYSATLASRRSAAPPALARVVGKHCEGGDILVRDEFLPADVAPGDLIAVPASGAYSRSMASNYNHVPRPPVVAVRDGGYHPDPAGDPRRPARPRRRLSVPADEARCSPQPDCVRRTAMRRTRVLAATVTSGRPPGSIAPVEVHEVDVPGRARDRAVGTRPSRCGWPCSAAARSAPRSPG